MILYVELPSGNTAKIGEMLPITKDLVSWYMKMYPRTWIQI